MRNREALTELVQKAQQLDPDAMNTLFEECRDPIYYFALKTVQDADAAEDVTQEAMIDIFRNLEKLKDPVAFQAWSREITYRQCLRYIKKTPEVLVSEDEDGHSVFDTLEEENADFIPDAAMESKEFQKTIRDMIDTLPVEQRTALLLYHFDNLSVKEIAQIQGVPENTVKSRLMYARKAIKASVESYEKKNGVKLHSFAVLPFIAWLLVQDVAATAMPAATAAAVATGVTAATGVTITATSGAAAGATAATAATATAAKAAVPLAAKIAAGVAAAGIAAGGVALGFGLLQPKEETRPTGPQYKSYYMEVYAESDRFQEEFAGIVGDNYAYYIKTQDNAVYSVTDPDTNILADREDVQEVIYADNTFGYRDSKNVTYLLCNEQFRAFPDLKGKVVHSRQGLLDSYQVFTLDGTQLYSSSYDLENDVVESINEPHSIIRDADGNVIETTEHLRFTTVFYLIDHETIYYAASGDTQMLGTYTTFIPADHARYSPYTVNDKPVKVTYLADPLYGAANSPVFSVEGDSEHIYYSSSYGGKLNEKLALPDGHTVSELRQILFAEDIYLLFRDGSVYTAGFYTDGAFEKLEHLSKLGKGGHISHLYLTDSRGNPELLALMDDDVLYRYIPDPELPEETPEQKPETDKETDSEKQPNLFGSQNF